MGPNMPHRGLFDYDRKIQTETLPLREIGGLVAQCVLAFRRYLDLRLCAPIS
jgi:hypothetical protein